MPTYEYGCSNCGNEWELEQRITANAIRKCPKCKKPKAQRLISGGNFILKGEGWFADLYHKPAAKPKKAESTSDSDSGSNSEDKPKSEDKSKDKPKSEDKPKSKDKPKKSKKKKGKSDAA